MSRLRTILSTRPPRPARPLNGTEATVAPRSSIACQTDSSDTSSCRPGRSRAWCVCEAWRPDGVRHESPGRDLQVGHGRSATRARRAFAFAGWSSARTIFGVERPAWLGKSGTTLAARRRGRSRCRIRSAPRSRSGELGPPDALGSAAAGPAQTRVSPGDLEGEWGRAARPRRVH